MKINEMEIRKIKKEEYKIDKTTQPRYDTEKK